MTRRDPNFFPKVIDQSVRNMTYAADVFNSGDYMCHLGSPPVADVNFYLSGSLTGTTAVTFSTFTANVLTGHRYGAVILTEHTVSLTGGTAAVITVTGRDYLGAVMTETITLNSASGTKAGVKAFQHVDKVVAAAHSLNHGVLRMGFGNALGLPYRTLALISGNTEIVNDSTVTSTGTFVPAGTITAQVAGSPDPRGTYDPTTTLNASRSIQISVRVDKTNLHGYAQA